MRLKKDAWKDLVSNERIDYNIKIIRPWGYYYLDNLVYSNIRIRRIYSSDVINSYYL